MAWLMAYGFTGTGYIDLRRRSRGRLGRRPRRRTRLWCVSRADAVFLLILLIVVGVALAVGVWWYLTVYLPLQVTPAL